MEHLHYVTLPFKINKENEILLIHVILLILDNFPSNSVSWKELRPAICELRRLEGQLSVLPNFTNPAIIFHIINDFNLNVKSIFKSTSFHNFIAAQVTAHQVHIEPWEKQIKQQL